MADNVGTIADSSGNFSDWFELYNPGSNTVNLTGYFLSDTLTNSTQREIPPGTTIPAGGYLLVWADNTTEQLIDGDLHVKFSLSKNGEAIALFAPDGVLIDGVLQNTGKETLVNVSQLFQGVDQRRLPPSLGYPVPVRTDGTIRLPMVEPTDQELAQVRACLERAGMLQPVQA